MGAVTIHAHPLVTYRRVDHPAAVDLLLHRLMAFKAEFRHLFNQEKTRGNLLRVLVHIHPVAIVATLAHRRVKNLFVGHVGVALLALAGSGRFSRTVYRDPLGTGFIPGLPGEKGHRKKRQQEEKC